MNITSIQTNSFRGLRHPLRTENEIIEGAPCKKCVAKNNCFGPRTYINTCQNPDVFYLKKNLFKGENGKPSEKYYPHPIATSAPRPLPYPGKYVVTVIGDRLPCTRKQFNDFMNGQLADVPFATRKAIKEAVEKIGETDFGNPDFHATLAKLELE